MVMPETIDAIKKNNPFINVVVSHNIMNQMNFLQLEMMHLNIPIIHNCKPFEDNKLYYDDYSTTACVDMIEWVRTDFFINSDYRAGVWKVINKFNPLVFERQEVYKNNIERLTNVYMRDNDSICGDKILVDSIVKVSTFIKNKCRIENSLFYNGQGIVILMSSRDEYVLLRNTMMNLINIENNCDVEIICCDTLTPLLEIESICSEFKQNSFKYEILQISNSEDEIIEDDPNSYMATVFSNFESGIFIKPGALFIKKPCELIKNNLYDRENSFTFYPTCINLKNSTDTNKKIYKYIVDELKLEPRHESDLLSADDIFFFNKKDMKCLKVLATLCELRKMIIDIIDTCDILDIVCRLNYENTNSRIDISKCYLYGEMNTKFQGYGLAFTNQNVNDFDIVFDSYASKNNFTKLLMVDCFDKNVCVIEHDEFPYTFSGQTAASRLPKAITALLS
jgi:hypothetical protein